MSTLVFVQNRDFYGNRLCHLPLLDALRRDRPGEPVSVLAPYSTGGFFRDVGFADRERHYPHRPLRMLRAVREAAPERIVTLRPSSEWLNAVIGLSGAGERAGFRSLTGRLVLTHPARRHPEEYRPDYLLRPARELGVEADLAAPFRKLAAGSGLELAPAEPRICVMPGGGTGDFKRWGVDRFLAVCRALADRRPDAGFVFLLGPDESEHRSAVRSSAVADRSTTLYRRPVQELAAAVAASDLAVANDCGPSHLAQMLGIPYLGLYADHDGRVEERLLEWFRPTGRSIALTGDRGRPIDSIPVDRVVEAAEGLLADRG